MNRRKVIVKRRIAYSGVKRAADALGVSHQAVSNYVRGYRGCLGPAKASRIKIVDETK